jgi:nucleotide-binding universal stress UspA family protein
MIPDIKKILYVTDLSKNAAYAFRYAVRMLYSFDARIQILSVLKKLDPVGAVPVITQMGESTFQNLREENRKQVDSRLQKRINAFCKKELNEKDAKKLMDRISIEVIEGDPSVEILRKAEESDIGLVVMGTHSKEIFTYTFLGGVTQRVLRHIRKPVLVVPLPKGEVELSFRSDDILS